MPLSEGTRLGPYEVLTLIGVGGMGEVYRGRDTRLNRAVAIKVISPRLAADPHFRDRFDREAITISQLNHPNVCTLYDVGHHDGVDFLVMELVDGQTLAEHLAQGPLPTDRVLDVAYQMAQALSHAHQLGIVHRDIKPQNVMLTEAGLVKILDFGLAKSEQPDGVSRAGVAIGTLGYMAPEQLLGDGAIGPETDVWALGVVLYEMLAGARPFVGKDAVSLFKGIVTDAPSWVREKRTDVPPEVDRLLRRALEKDPDRRHASAADFALELAACRTALNGRVGRSRRVTPLRALAAGAAFVAVAVFGVRAFNEERQIRWARQQALPEIERLLQQDRYAAAFTLARQAEAHLGGDPALARIWPLASVTGSLTTEPDGADVSFKPYDDVSGPWQPLGRTPIADARLPRGALRFRVEKEGFDAVHLARMLTSAFQLPTVTLSREGSSDGMVPVDGEAVPVNLSGFNTETLVTLGPFAMDRTEVTNRAFKEFVDAGGYATAASWVDARDAVAAFVDSTGRPGPASWEFGDFPAGRADEPVGGVSWYEAAAYCGFRGKQLPTVFHWSRAALAPREFTAPLGPSIVPLSNFAGEAIAPAGKYAGMGPYGTADMAGNVREWIWNTAAAGRRWILGGAYNDPDYMFSVPFSLPAGDRSPTNGFRCMKTAGAAPVPAHLLARVDVSSPDYRGARPVTDEVYSVFVEQFAYVPSHSAGRVEARETLPNGSVRERVTVDAGYDDERLTIYVFTSPDGTPPYQTLVYFPALTAFQSGTSSHTFFPGDYVVKSGRALVLPVYKGSFERRDAVMGLVGEEYRRGLRLRLLQWRQDVGRTIDYLATRGDIDMEKIGYYGRSFGASVPLGLLALEPRFRLAILHSAGLTYRTLPPEVDPVNYLPRVRMPTLMLTGRHDYVLPVETSQKPLFDLLGTPAVNRKHVIFDAGHDPLPRSQFVREILAWLDRFFGVPPSPT